MAGVGNATTLGGGGATGGGGGTAAAASAPTTTAEKWELSDYELQRTPQEAITDATEIAVSPTELHLEFKCPICQDMLHETMITKGCLHRFCDKCINDWLRKGNKKCPNCRNKIVSKRSLRPDLNFDMLISNIYPSRSQNASDDTTAQLGGGGGTTTTGGNNSGSRKGADAGPSQNNNNVGVAGAVPPPAAPGASNGQPVNPESIGDNSSNTSVGSDKITEVELELKPHPDMQWGSSGGGGDVHQSATAAAAAGLGTDHIQTHFLKTSGNATVDYLRKYLGMRLALDSDGNEEGPLRNCTIWIRPHNNFIKIPPVLTLDQICAKYWRFNKKPLELYYYWKKV